MNKNFGLIVAAAAAIALTAAGCGKENPDPELKNTEASSGTEAGGKEKEIPAEDLEPGPVIMEQYSETADYRELADFLIAYYEIPEEFHKDTRYYYNYVDLNEDGKNEIFVAVIGKYTSGSSGDSALILKKEESGAFSVLESFVMLHTPILISDHMTNGWHDIAYQVYGGGIDPGYIICRYSNTGGYQTDGNEFVDELKGMSGIRILANNLIDDMDKGAYLTLASQEDESYV